MSPKVMLPLQIDRMDCCFPQCAPENVRRVSVVVLVAQGGELLIGFARRVLRSLESVARLLELALEARDLAPGGWLLLGAPALQFACRRELRAALVALPAPVARRWSARRLAASGRCAGAGCPRGERRREHV